MGTARSSVVATTVSNHGTNGSQMRSVSPLERPLRSATSRPIDAVPPLVQARSGDLLAVADELEGRGYRKIGVEGGGQLIRGLIAIGRLRDGEIQPDVVFVP